MTLFQYRIITNNWKLATLLSSTEIMYYLLLCLSFVFRSIGAFTLPHNSEPVVTTKLGRLRGVRQVSISEQKISNHTLRDCRRSRSARLSRRTIRRKGYWSTSISCTGNDRCMDWRVSG